MTIPSTAGLGDVPVSTGPTPDTSNLLQRLIQEGLTASGRESNVDPVKFRRLLEVLFQACIVNPSKKQSITHDTIERATYTITILSRQTNTTPEILSPDLYKWALPRLIHAARGFQAIQGAEGLARDVRDAAAGLLALLGRDIVGDQSIAKGLVKVALVNRQMRDFCQAACSSNIATLFGYTDLVCDKRSALLIMDIALRNQAFLADDISVAFCDILSEMEFDPIDESLFLEVITLLIGLNTTPQKIAQICTRAAALILSEFARPQSVVSFIDALEVADPVIRAEVWWTLYDRVEQIHHRSGQLHRTILFMLTPIPNTLPADTIHILIPEAVLNHWESRVGDLNPVERLAFEQLGRQTSRKRKRPPSAGNDRLWMVLQTCCPHIQVIEDPVAALSMYIQRHQSDDLENLQGSLAKLFSLMASTGRSEPCLDIWLVLANKTKVNLGILRSLVTIFKLVNQKGLAAQMQLASRRPILDKIWKAFQGEDRGIRVAAGRIISLLFFAQEHHPNAKVASNNRRATLARLGSAATKSVPVQETVILTLSEICRNATEEYLGDCLILLVGRLGCPSAPLRSIAYVELQSVARYRAKTPYTLLSPYLDRISVILASSIFHNTDLVSETMQFIGYSRRTFFDMTLRHTVPALVLASNRASLQLIAAIVGQPEGILVLDYVAEILARLFMGNGHIDVGLSYVIELLKSLATVPITPASLMTSSMIPFIVALVTELGDTDRLVVERATTALYRAHQVQNSDQSLGADLGLFLKPHMLGVISQLNEILHDIQGKKTVEFKQKVIRSLERLIELVGDSMSSFSPQIIASFQSTLGIEELRTETLKAWSTFISTLRYADIGPFVGRTTGAIVANWGVFNSEERKIAAAIMMELAGNAGNLGSYRDEIVGFDHIHELREPALQLVGYRDTWPVETRILKVLERTRSKNNAVATTSMRELKELLLKNTDELSKLSQGDVFDPVIGRAIQTILAAIRRDGDCQELRNLGHECFGIIGALDPDRVISSSDHSSLIIMNNFTEQEESTAFAVHLIRDLLVDAFRATNDTKHQSHLAFAIQELLQFCGFTPKILQSNGTVPPKVRTKWLQFPKDQHETLAPLLGSRFSLTSPPVKTFPHPIYPTVATYREWIQLWTTDLIGKILLAEERGSQAKQIFGVFRGVLKNQDVTVAHHILPHLVLNVLLSGEPECQKEICEEINTVLAHQVSATHTSSADKPMLSAQVIFDLMDHLSKWLRQQRVSRSDRAPHMKIVDKVLSSIETELMARAALQSKAYARSLRNFEQRITTLRADRRQPDLQSYYERLHQIYAEIDEPDGMEGVSTFVIAPSLEHQIREHESTGRWTSAQSCWEVRLQQSPDDVSLHVGLMRCLQNLGHYDTLRTHIRGVLSRHPQWSGQLAAFEVEAAWIIGDWPTVRASVAGSPIAQVLLNLREGRDMKGPIATARQQLGQSIGSAQYSRVHDSILQLHLLREIELIHEVDGQLSRNRNQANGEMINDKILKTLNRTLADRFETTSPAFRVRETILSMRRTAFKLASSPRLRPEIGNAWLATSKIARKAGYEQTAYSAALQAQSVDAPFAFLQQAKLSRAHGGAFKALVELENAVTPVLNDAATNHRTDGLGRGLAKAVIVEARWAIETDRFDRNEIITRYRRAIELDPHMESAYYHLGHYYDTQQDGTSASALFNLQTCRNYILALQQGVKYIYRTMPRMLTLWLDLGENKDVKRHPDMQAHLQKITSLLDKARKDLPLYQFLSAFPQIVSRIGHADKEVATILHKLTADVVAKYPQQALWPMVGVMHSNQAERKKRCTSVLSRAQHNSTSVQTMIKDATLLSRNLLRLAEDKVEDKRREASINTHYSYMKEVFPSRMIVPLQDALTCSLPSTAETVRTHNPFPSQTVEIAGMEDRITIMSSLQKPKKLYLHGTDGRSYPFLCKPHDDLRKDARLMDFNTMINKLLKSASESRRRQLYIRTYAVTPLNDECGLLEWVSNTNALKNLLEEGYQRHQKKIWPPELPGKLEQARKSGSAAQITFFRDTVLKMFSPSVFADWFFQTWPEPSAWLASRMAYARTLAVMSMIGYVLGLGDRHGENILFDTLTGDTVHVDLNCLFDKGKTFEIPERVPFRLTHNMVDALGVTGVEGVFRKAAEISLGVLRNNSESLMSVLEAFAHDPLVEWTKKSTKSEAQIRNSADKNLRPIRQKLKGNMEEGPVVSVPNQVDRLIKQATSTSNLAQMYQGWAAWL